MHLSRLVPIVLLAVLITITPCSLLAADSWPQFRGPSGDGNANGQSVPTEFGEDSNVAWKTSLPGRAWSSPVVAGGVVWVTTAVERVPSEEERLEMLQESGVEKKKFNQLAIAKSIDLQLLQIDVATGSMKEPIELATVENPDPIHSLNSYASPTPVTDEKHIYCHFGTYGTFCLERSSGKMLWERRVTLEHSVGPGSSPFLMGNKLVLIQDGVDRQYVMALDKATGETLWEKDRPEMVAPSGDMKKAFCTPISIKDESGRDQLICMGSQWIVSYDPATGDEIWKVHHGKGFSVVPRPVFGEGVVYFSTGFGKPELWAVKVDGSGDVSDTHVLWTQKQGIPAKPSPLLHDGLIYVMADNGVASCLDIADGEIVWKKRIGGDFSSSPTLAGGNIYFGSQGGKISVIKPGREVDVIAENAIEGQIMASPAVVDNAMIWRTNHALYRFQTK